MIKDKKGFELSMTFLIPLIVGIIGFIIILVVISNLDLFETAEETVCRESVELRSSALIPAEAVPLQCSLKYLCITRDGSCDKMSGDYDVEKVKTEDEVYSILAEEMGSCWYMYGEGELNYVKEDLTQELYCSPCTQIYLDDSLENIFGLSIDKESFYEYLDATEMEDEGITYLEYFFEEENLITLKNVLKSEDSSFGSFEFGKFYYVMTGQYNKISSVKWAIAGAGAGIVLVATGGLAAPILLVAGAGAGGAYFLAGTYNGLSGQQYLSPTIVEVNSEDYKNLNCNYVTTIA